MKKILLLLLRITTSPLVLLYMYIKEIRVMFSIKTFPVFHSILMLIFYPIAIIFSKLGDYDIEKSTVSVTVCSITSSIFINHIIGVFIYIWFPLYATLIYILSGHMITGKESESEKQQLYNLTKLK